jgi:hypothetical protein
MSCLYLVISLTNFEATGPLIALRDIETIFRTRIRKEVSPILLAMSVLWVLLLTLLRSLQWRGS